MLNRREMIAGSIALAGAGIAHATPRANTRRDVIDSIAVPPGFSGVIAHGARGRTLYARAIGTADVARGRPIAADTQFRWGSATKWLSSVAVLRLVDQGKLALDAPLTTWLPDFRADTGNRVTLRHLLSNTSGIPDLLSRQLGTEPQLRSSLLSPAAMVTRFAGGDLQFEPGSGWDYAALNWVVVAAIIERITGQPFPTAMRRLVLDPLRMTRAGFDQPGQPPLPHLAKAYDSATPASLKLSPTPPFIAAIGNIAGTVQDAMRAGHGIFHGAILRPDARAALIDIRWPAQEYALGGRIHSIDGDAWAWEAGKVGGYRTLIAHRLIRSETIIIYNNTDMEQPVLTEWAERIARA